MTEEAVKALVLEWLQSTGVPAVGVWQVRGHGTDWAGSTDEGFRAAFTVTIEYATEARNSNWIDVEGQQMSALWDFVLDRAYERATRDGDTEPAPDVSWVTFEERGPLGGVHETTGAPMSSDPAGSDTGVADSDRGTSSGTNLRPGGEPSPSRQGRAESDVRGTARGSGVYGELEASRAPDPARRSPRLPTRPATGVRPGAGGRPSGQFDP